MRRSWQWHGGRPQGGYHAFGLEPEGPPRVQSLIWAPAPGIAYLVERGRERSIRRLRSEYPVRDFRAGEQWREVIAQEDDRQVELTCADEARGSCERPASCGAERQGRRLTDDESIEGSGHAQERSRLRRHEPDPLGRGEQASCRCNRGYAHERVTDQAVQTMSTRRTLDESKGCRGGTRVARVARGPPHADVATVEPARERQATPRSSFPSHRRPASDRVPTDPDIEYAEGASPRASEQSGPRFEAEDVEVLDAVVLPVSLRARSQQTAARG